MEKTKISDIIIPELFTPYVIQQIKETSALANSGIMQSNVLLDELINKGERIINLLLFDKLSGNDEVINDSDSLAPIKNGAGNANIPVFITLNEQILNKIALYTA